MIVVGFAGGGGTCRGIEKGLGRGPDLAINHDRDAIEMHRINHPACRHIMSDILGVDPVKATRGRPVGLAWFSPDCTHFSQAKGGTPVKKEIRDLAWVVIRWAKEVSPDVIMLENVREFMTWGPLIQQVKGGVPQSYPDGSPKMMPDPARKGDTFRAWKACLEELGYAVEHRVLKACDYGTPTTRPRLYLIARRDGKLIEWPAATHGPKGSRLKPYRTAAECIDFSIPCPSIFMTREEATAYRKATGIACVRPLASNTLDRIGRGYWRYVGNNPNPFIVRRAHGNDGRRGRGEHPIGESLPTLAGSKDFALVTPYLTERYGERDGQEARCKPADRPLGVVTTTGNTGTLIAPSLVQVNHGGDAFRGQDVRDSMPTISAKHGFGVASAFLTKHYTGQVGQEIIKPAPTITGRATQNMLTAANLIRLNHGQKQWQGCDEPTSVVTAGGNHLAVIQADLAAAYVLKNNAGSDAQAAADPLHVITGGNRFTAVYAFLIHYYGASTGQAITDPVYTITGHDRFGLVTVTIDGQVYAVADIGLRMLTPRELLAAQFTPEIARTYVLTGTKTSQVHKIGNSVCPPVAAALVRSNCPTLRARAA